MAHRQVLVKIVSQVVTAVMDGDKVLGETEGPRIACYSPEESAELWETAQQELKDGNAELNRAARRRKK